jgi:hypothetical protein
MVERLDAWSIKTPPGYDPGWESTPSETPADLFAKLKSASLEDAKKLSTLLNIPEYLAAMKVVREVNDRWGLDKPGQADAKRRDKAIMTLKRFEEGNHLDGVVHAIDQ